MACSIVDNFANIIKHGISSIVVIILILCTRCIHVPTAECRCGSQAYQVLSNHWNLYYSIVDPHLHSRYVEPPLYSRPAKVESSHSRAQNKKSSMVGRVSNNAHFDQSLVQFVQTLVHF